MVRKRWTALPDIHGDYWQESAVKQSLRFVDDFKPEIRISLGDVFDFRWLRAKASERDINDRAWEADIDNGQWFLRKYKPTKWVMGNHDWRARKAMDDPKVALAQAGTSLWEDMVDTAGPQCEIIDYNKRRGVYKLGDTLFLHGYSAGVGAVRKHALTYGRCVIGHLHVIDSVTIEHIDAPTCWCVGTLSQLELGYNEQQIGTLRQAHGFAWGYVENGHVTVNQARFHNGRLEDRI